MQVSKHQFRFCFLLPVGLCTSDTGLGQVVQEELRFQMCVGNGLTGMKLCSFSMILPHNLKVTFTLSNYTHRKL